MGFMVWMVRMVLGTATILAHGALARQRIRLRARGSAATLPPARVRPFRRSTSDFRRPGRRTSAVERRRTPGGNAALVAPQATSAIFAFPPALASAIILPIRAAPRHV